MKHIIPADRCWQDSVCPYRCPHFVMATYDVAKREWATRPWCRRQDKEVVNGARVQGCRIRGPITIEFEEGPIPHDCPRCKGGYGWWEGDHVWVDCPECGKKEGTP